MLLTRRPLTKWSRVVCRNSRSTFTTSDKVRQIIGQTLVCVSIHLECWLDKPRVEIATWAAVGVARQQQFSSKILAVWTRSMWIQFAFKQDQVWKCLKRLIDRWFLCMTICCKQHKGSEGGCKVSRVLLDLIYIYLSGNFHMINLCKCINLRKIFYNENFSVYSTLYHSYFVHVVSSMQSVQCLLPKAFKRRERLVYIYASVNGAPGGIQ